MKVLEPKPVKEVLVSLHLVSYLFALCALIAGIAWIYYTAKAVEQDQIGASDGQTAGAVSTATSMWEATVIAVLFYLMFRHHFTHVHA